MIVIIESPFRGADGDYEAAALYLDYCIRDCVIRLKETPYASHRMLPGALGDTKPEQRALGMKAGIEMSVALINCCGAKAAFYTDIGFSEGMVDAMAHYLKIEIVSKGRSLPVRALPPKDFEAYQQELRELRAK